MSAILAYVRNFLTLFLLIKVLLFLIPKSGFLKYISFFAGVILVIGMLHPALKLFHLEETWMENLYYDTFEEKMLEVSLNADYLQEENGERYREQVEKMLEAEMEGYVQAAGFLTKDVTVELSEEYEVERLILTITEGNEEEYPMLKEKLLRDYQLSKEQCEITYE